MKFRKNRNPKIYRGSVSALNRVRSSTIFTEPKPYDVVAHLGFQNSLKHFNKHISKYQSHLVHILHDFGFFRSRGSENPNYLRLCLSTANEPIT